MKIILILMAIASLSAQTIKLNPFTSQLDLVGSGGGSSGITYIPTRTSGTVLTLPAIVTNTMAVGTYACGAVASSTFTVSSGTGTVWMALASDCTVVARHNIVGSCSANCTAVSGSSGFLNTDLPLYEWTVTAGALAATGTNRLLPNMSVPLVAGANCSIVTSNGVMTISCGSSFPPLAAATETYDYDDFVSGACQGNITYNSKLGWQLNSNSGGETVSCSSDVATNHPGVLTASTLGTSGSDAALKWPNTSITPADTFTYRALVKMSATTTVKYSIALTDDNFNNVSSDGCYFEKLTADTNWFVACMAAGVASTRQDTGVAVGTGWIAFQIQRTSASNIAFRTATTLGGLAGATVFNITTNIPTVNIRPAFFVESTAAVVRAMAIDYADLRITGMTR